MDVASSALHNTDQAVSREAWRLQCRPCCHETASLAAVLPVEEVDPPLFDHILGLSLGERLCGVGCRSGLCCLAAVLCVCLLVFMLLCLSCVAAGLCLRPLVFMLLLRLLVVFGVLSCRSNPLDSKQFLSGRKRTQSLHTDACD